LYFFLLMLYKTSTCKIFWLCAVDFFSTTFIQQLDYCNIQRVFEQK
jgi:hypothetical protein